MEKYPYRIPKKYPKKDLHGRVRMLLMSYHDFARFQKFWVDLFGWDMFALPEAAGGTKPGDPNPSLLVATGPSYETWEGVVPGHMNAMVHHAKGELEPISFALEIHMDEPIMNTVNDVICHGGELIGEEPVEVEGWVAQCCVKDPSGNILSLGKCPSSRTWDEAEAGYDKD